MGSHQKVQGKSAFVCVLVVYLKMYLHWDISVVCCMLLLLPTLCLPLLPGG